MTDAQILAQDKHHLQIVKSKISVLQKMNPTPAIMAEVMRLAELRDNLELSIADLDGAIMAGADNSNPLSGWC